MPFKVILFVILLLSLMGTFSYIIWQRGHKFWVILIIGAHALLLVGWFVISLFSKSKEEVVWQPRMKVPSEPRQEHPEDSMPEDSQKQDWRTQPPPSS